MNRTRRTTAVLALAAVAAAGGGVAATSAASSSNDLTKVKAATARYHSLAQATRHGFSGEHEPCVSSPDGAMGIHYVNGARVADPAVNPLAPEVLLYLPDGSGKLTLVGVEYLVIDRDQDLSTDGDRPSLFGQPFDGPMPGHAPGMPIHYDLHAWVWSDNPSGMYAPFNSGLSCP